LSRPPPPPTLFPYTTLFRSPLSTFRSNVDISGMDLPAPPPAEARARRMRPANVATAAAVLVCAVLFGWMRVGEAQVVHRSFLAMCTRLSMRPGDWPCRVADVQIIQAYVGAAILGGMALALPAAVLAAAG